MPSLRPTAVALTALLLSPAVHAGDVSAALADRYSIGSTTPPAATAGVTLLDPTWLLPPLEALETAAVLADDAERAGEILRDDPTVALGRPPSAPSNGPVSYSLSDDLSAQLRYQHAQPFSRADSRTLRDDESTGFSTRPDRDVVGLDMSWRLAGNIVGVGYQLQSARGGSLPGEVGVSRFLPGSPQATHSLTLGLTHEWGAPDPPPLLIDPPLLDLQVDLAAVEATPTPAP